MAGKVDFVPPIVVEPTPLVRDVGPRQWQKFVCGAVTAVLIVAIIAAGFICAFFYMHKTSVEAIQSKDMSFEKDGESIRETMRMYDDDVYRYDLKSSNGNYSVVEDYSRRTVLLRRDGSDTQHCVLITMDNTYSGQREQGLKQDATGNGNDTKKIGYELVEPVIKNHDILGDVGMEMCNGYQLYWGVPQTQTENTQASRNKRSAWPPRFPPPGVPIPGVPSPGVPSPGVPSPGVPSPGVPSPGVPSPGVPSPGVTVHPVTPLTITPPWHLTCYYSFFLRKWICFCAVCF